MNQNEMIQGKFPVHCCAAGLLMSPGGFLHQKRCFPEHVLICVTEGSLFLSVDKTSYDVEKGQAILLPAGIFHEGRKTSEGQLRYFWAHFSGEGEPPFTGVIRLSEQSRVTVLFRQLTDYALESEKLPDPFCDHAGALLLLEILRQQDGREVTAGRNDKILQIASWIRGHYAENFTVELLGERFGYRKDYLSSLFKRQMGVSITEYTNQVRIRASKSLLADYGLSVKEAAFACGFQDEKYYMRVFKKQEGMTPSRFKETFCRSLIN